MDPVLEDLKIQHSETFRSLSSWNKDSEDGEVVGVKDSEDSEVEEVVGRQLSRHRVLRRHRRFRRDFSGVFSLITKPTIVPIILIIYYSTCYSSLMRKTRKSTSKTQTIAIITTTRLGGVYDYHYGGVRLP